MSSTAFTSDGASEIMYLANYWRQRYFAEAWLSYDDKIFTAKDIASITDSNIWKRDPNLSIAIHNFFSQDLSYFNTVKWQLESLLRVWDITFEEKKKYDNRKRNFYNHEIMQAFLLCGKLIPTRANIVPAPRSWSQSSVSLSNPSQNTTILDSTGRSQYYLEGGHHTNKSAYVRPYKSRPTPLNIPPVPDCRWRLASHPYANKGNRKRTISEVEWDEHEDEPPHKRVKRT